MARSAERLTSMMPFFLTATLFANARMSRGEGIYKLVQEVFRVAEAPYRAFTSVNIDDTHCGESQHIG